MNEWHQHLELRRLVVRPALNDLVQILSRTCWIWS